MSNYSGNQPGAGPVGELFHFSRTVVSKLDDLRFFLRRSVVPPVTGMLSVHNRFRAGLWSSRYAHAIGRNVARFIFAMLATCTSPPSSFDSMAAPHRTEAMRDNVPIQDHTKQGLASVMTAVPPVPNETAWKPFGLDATPVAFGDVQAKWRKVEVDIRADIEILAQCREHMESCPPAAQHFLEIIKEGRARDGRARIGVINRAINLAIRPTSDFAQWGVPDRWSSPLETFSTGRGDCEDYAIAKYVALVEAGVSEEDVKLIIVQDLATNQGHAVVAVRLNGDWIVLDNRWFALVRDVDMSRVIPLFMLDYAGLKQIVPNKEDRNLGILADNLEIAPAEISKLSQRANPELATKELSKRPSKDWSAFLDNLTSFVDSGNLLVKRRLTTADMRDYATRAYRSRTADNSGN
jgi:predicted transglutaminase-like cysteine proteinase